MSAMIDLVRKRHDGDGWIVFEELGNKPGYHRDRTADAVALGVWASKKYEAHLYEFKISREDLKRELRDPSKGESVGRFCHYRWLVVDHEKRITDLAIPDYWGIMVVRTDKVAGKEIQRLSVKRQAPKQKPEPFNHLFAVAAIRNIRSGYVDPSDYRRLEAEIAEIKYGTKRELSEDEQTDKRKIALLERQVADLKSGIERFSRWSGVDLVSETPWSYGTIGRAVKIVLELGTERHFVGDLRDQIAKLSAASEMMERQARELAQDAIKMRALMPSVECTQACQSNSRWRSRCECGAKPMSEVERKLAANAPLPSTSSPSDRDHDRAALAVVATQAAASGHDDEGSGVDRGGAGTPE